MCPPNDNRYVRLPHLMVLGWMSPSKYIHIATSSRSTQQMMNSILENKSGPFWNKWFKSLFIIDRYSQIYLTLPTSCDRAKCMFLKVLLANCKEWCIHFYLPNVIHDRLPVQLMVPILNNEIYKWILTTAGVYKTLCPQHMLALNNN